MVSATPSGGWLTGAPVVPELGFCLGTRGQMFWLEEGLASSLQPGKRPRTTLSPTMVARDGEPYLALGTPGGDQQDQWSLHAFLAHVNFGMDLQMAIDAPTHHTEAFPSSFYPALSAPGTSPSKGGPGQRRSGGSAPTGTWSRPRPLVARARQRREPRRRRAIARRRRPTWDAGLCLRALTRRPHPRPPAWTRHASRSLGPARSGSYWRPPWPAPAIVSLSSPGRPRRRLYGTWA